jgi:hypothetical protein
MSRVDVACFVRLWCVSACTPRWIDRGAYRASTGYDISTLRHGPQQASSGDQSS